MSRACPRRKCLAGFSALASVAVWAHVVLHDFLLPGTTRHDSPCHCRKLPVGVEFMQQSACSAGATARGPGQRVVSFCLYGKVNPYLEGILANLEGVRNFYPGFTMRIYHNFLNGGAASDNLRTLCEVYCSNPELDLCDVHAIGPLGDVSWSAGMIWRFAPMADSLVDEWHSRDLDSTIFDREVAAVNDWRDNSNATFHVMRDHFFHRIAMLGGMFGMRAPVGTGADDDHEHRAAHIRAMAKVFFKVLRSARGPSTLGKDQTALVSKLWPEVLKSRSLVAHDSYHCFDADKDGVEVRPFPTRRKTVQIGNQHYSFVGSNGGNLSKECPKECRPEEHPDWEMC